MCITFLDHVSIDVSRDDLGWSPPSGYNLTLMTDHADLVNCYCRFKYRASVSYHRKTLVKGITITVSQSTS